MPTPIQNPAGYAVTRAVAFADVDGSMLPVAASTPLPVTLGMAPTIALTGTANATSLAGPYQPALGRPVPGAAQSGSPARSMAVRPASR